MITVREIEEVRKLLIDIFPDAVRGSVAKTHWKSGRKQLNLSYWIGSDTVGGLMIEGNGDMYYFVEWDTNMGRENLFAEREQKDMVLRVRAMFYEEIHRINRVVGEV